MKQSHIQILRTRCNVEVLLEKISNVQAHAQSVAVQL